MAAFVSSQVITVSVTTVFDAGSGSFLGSSTVAYSFPAGNTVMVGVIQDGVSCVAASDDGGNTWAPTSWNIGSLGVAIVNQAPSPAGHITFVFQAGSAMTINVTLIFGQYSAFAASRGNTFYVGSATPTEIVVTDQNSPPPGIRGQLNSLDPAKVWAGFVAVDLGFGQPGVTLNGPDPTYGGTERQVINGVAFTTSPLVGSFALVDNMAGTTGLSETISAPVPDSAWASYSSPTTPPPPLPGTIIVTKQTNPSGTPQLFTFTPSWAASFTLMDGQSRNSGPLTAGTYSVSETPVPGFTTTTNIDPTNIVLGAGQTVTVVFTNTAITAPCVPLEGGVMVDGALIPDLGLYVGPSTALYTDPIPTSSIKTYETVDEGRHAVVFDFNNSDGLYSRDLGTIFEWPLTFHDVLYVWQPSIIPMPETVYGRASDWDDGGYTGDKFIQGITIEADSFGAAKTFQLQSSDDLTLHTLNEVPTTFIKQTLKSFSCDPFISHSVRIVASDGVRWRVWGSKLVFQPLPSACIQWQTELVSLGMIGWTHAREMNIPHISTADITLTLTFDAWPSINLTIPNSGGIQAKTKVTLPPNKWKLIGLRALSAQPFRLFEGDLELKVKPWGSTESYNVLRPFGGPSQPGATV